MFAHGRLAGRNFLRIRPEIGSTPGLRSPPSSTYKPTRWNEARRFLRYVNPGLVFAVQALLLLFIINPAWTTTQLLRQTKDAGAGLAVALFLALGGLGYLFSVVHHRLHWSLPWLPFEGLSSKWLPFKWLSSKWLPFNWLSFKWLSAIDHTRVVNKLLDADFLDLQKLHGKNLVKIDRETDKIDRRAAWVIVIAVWKESLRSTSGIQSADACATGLTDIMHSAGTARIATISALGVVGLWSVLDVYGQLGAHSGLMPFSRFYGGSIAMTIVSIVIAALLGVLLLVLHHVNYLRTGELTERFIHEVLSDTLLDRKNEPATEKAKTAAEEGETKPATVTIVELP